MSPFRVRQDCGSGVAHELTDLDFDVLVDRDEQEYLPARVVNAPAGQTPPVAFAMPFTPLSRTSLVSLVNREA